MAQHSFREVNQDSGRKDQEAFDIYLGGKYNEEDYEDHEFKQMPKRAMTMANKKTQ